MRPKTYEHLVYEAGMSAQEFTRVLYAVAFPVAVLALGLFTISSFENFGTKLICPLSCAMWVMGIVVSFLIPGERNKNMRHTLMMLTGYYGALLGLKVILGVVSGVSPEMIAASYNQAIPTAVGNTIVGYMQQALLWTSCFTPLGFIAAQAKMLNDFRHTSAKDVAFNRAVGMRQSQNRIYKHH